MLLRKLNRTVAAAAPSAAPVATRSVAAEPATTTGHSPEEVTAQGTWTMKIPSPLGVSTCYWEVRAIGTYQFSNSNTLVMTGKLGTGAWLRQK